jgi:hypothetical protein
MASASVVKTSCIEAKITEISDTTSILKACILKREKVTTGFFVVLLFSEAVP